MTLCCFSCGKDLGILTPCVKIVSVDPKKSIPNAKCSFCGDNYQCGFLSPVPEIVVDESDNIFACFDCVKKAFPKITLKPKVIGPYD